MAGMFYTAVLGVLALVIGGFVNGRIGFLRRVCIPSPVTGGLVVSLVFLALHCFTGSVYSFDATLKDVCMVLFFTSIGLQADFKVLKSGGKPLVVMVILVAVLIIMQNLIGVFLAGTMGQTRLLGMAVGSITMCGGHGTAGGFCGLLEQMGLRNAETVSMAAATAGLLCGSLLGGPIANLLIVRNGLCRRESREPSDSVPQTVCEAAAPLGQPGLYKGACILIVAAGLGFVLNALLARTGLSFPVYFGSLIMGIVIRNVSDLLPGCPKLSVAGIRSIGEISLSVFLGMAMATLKLWELSEIALPMLIILLAQVLAMGLFSYFLAFPLLGRDYDAALLVSGLCGFGLGATPNAMANMSAVCSKHRYSARPFVIIPMVGALFVDLINVAVITFFLNVL